MTVTIEGVQVKVVRDEQNFFKYAIVVQVYSVKKPGLKSTNTIDPGKASDSRHLLQLVSVAGAACAEYLCETYGDSVDPSNCANYALKAFTEECRLQHALTNSSMADKIHRLEQQQSRLKNDDQETLLKMRWVLDKGLKLTVSEIAWLDKKIAGVHSNQV